MKCRPRSCDGQVSGHVITSSRSRLSLHQRPYRGWSFGGVNECTDKSRLIEINVAERLSPGRKLIRQLHSVSTPALQACEWCLRPPEFIDSQQASDGMCDPFPRLKGVTGWLNRYSVGLKFQRTEVRIPSGAQENNCEFVRVKNVVLTRCRCAHAAPVCIRTHTIDHVCAR